MAATVPAKPRDPLRTYQFRIGFADGASGGGNVTYVAGVRTVSGLRAQVTAYETWEGGNNLHRYANPNRVIWEPITLEQGLALDATLEQWADAVLEFTMTGTPAKGNFPKPSAAGTTSTRAVKRQLVLDVYDENEFPAGPPTPAPPLTFDPKPQTAARAAIDRNRRRRYRIYNAWVSKYQAVPKLDSMTSEVSLLSVELMHEGWIREDF